MGVVTNPWPINGSNPVTVGGLGVTPKYFQFPSGNFTSGVTPNPGPSASSGFGQLAVHGDNVLNGQLFYVTASGNFEVGAGGACPGVTIDIVANTGTQVSPIWTILGTTGVVTAQSLDGVFYPWFYELKMVGDSASGTLTGTQSGSVDNTTISGTPLTHTLSGLNFNPTQVFPAVSGQPNAPVFGLAVRVTFSVSEAGNSANMYYFAINQ